MMSWNEEKVELEILTLRRARQMTKEGLKNRIRTGGSLMQPARKVTAGDATDTNRRFMPDVSLIDEMLLQGQSGGMIED